MKKNACFLLILLWLMPLAASANPELSGPLVQDIALDSFFADQKGCAIFFNETANSYDVYHKELLDTRVAPCSTFKIPCALIGLKYGVLQNSRTVFAWDGVKRPFNSWNQDLTLKEAFAYSAVWYFERVADAVGMENMRQTVRSISYGNCDTTAGGTFWLDASLTISPKEQVEFIKKLFNYGLPFEKEHIDVVKEIMYRGDLKGGRLYGKTGTSAKGDNGWFVGAYEKNGSRIDFAVRLYAGEKATGPEAKKITEDIIQAIY